MGMILHRLMAMPLDVRKGSALPQFETIFEATPPTKMFEAQPLSF